MMMGAMNLRRSLSPLYAECEALIWAMECMKTLQFSDVVFATDCSQLVKMVSSPEDWPAFATHMEEFSRNKTFFPSFKITHIPRAQNTIADKLARGARRIPQLCYMLIPHHRFGYMNRWFPLSVVSYVVKKKN